MLELLVGRKTLRVSKLASVGPGPGSTTEHGHREGHLEGRVDDVAGRDCDV